MRSDPVARGRLPPGAGFAIGSALLFGLSTPCAKVLVGETPPLLLAGLLYAGSGLGLFVAWLALPVSAAEARLTRPDVPWLAGAVVAGGVLGPVLLMSGLRTTPASAASLLLNLEGVFTAVLAWLVFHENVDRRIALGFALIVAGSVVLSWGGGTGRLALPLGVLAIVGACLAWAVDNNLTQRISGADPVGLAAIKGGTAGASTLRSLWRPERSGPQRAWWPGRWSWACWATASAWRSSSWRCATSARHAPAPTSLWRRSSGP